MLKVYSTKYLTEIPSVSICVLRRTQFSMVWFLFSEIIYSSFCSCYEHHNWMRLIPPSGIIKKWWKSWRGNNKIERIKGETKIIKDNAVHVVFFKWYFMFVFYKMPTDASLTAKHQWKINASLGINKKMMIKVKK